MDTAFLLLLLVVVLGFIFEFVNARSDPYVLSDAEWEAIEESRRQAGRGEFATDEQVEAVFAKYRR